MNKVVCRTILSSISLSMCVHTCIDKLMCVSVCICAYTCNTRMRMCIYVPACLFVLYVCNQCGLATGCCRVICSAPVKGSLCVQ